jgi:serine/threonine-protein kinase
LQPTTATLSKSSAAPTTSAAPDPSALRVASTSNLPWRPIVAGAQQAIASENLKGAVEQLTEAFDKGGHGVPRTMREHLQAAMSADAAKGGCKLTGLSRPRTYDLTPANPKPVAGGAPSIALGPRGAVVAWTDAHDGANHAYAVPLDEAMRNAADPVDVTPEGTLIGRPELTAVGDKFVLTYWDAKGSESGVLVRWLDADGRIAGPAVKVAPSKGGNLWPSLARNADGTFFVAWTSDGDVNSEDLFLRKLTATLEPAGDTIRATDLFPITGPKPRIRFPSLTVQDDALHVAYRLERDPLRLINHMRLPIADAAKGLPSPKGAPTSERTLGDVVLVNADHAKADGPSLACSPTACFIVWFGEQGGGALAAVIDPSKSKPNWWKKFSKTGSHPSVAIAATGQAQIVWYEAGTVVTASIDRDTVGPMSKIARVAGDQPMPAIVAGSKPGEWYLAWLHYEGGHLEPYAARILCR